MSQVIGHSRPSSVTESAPGLNRHSTTGEMGDLNLSRSHDSRLQRAKKHNTKKQRKQTLFKFIDDADADEDELDPALPPPSPPLSPLQPRSPRSPRSASTATCRRRAARGRRRGSTA